MRETSFQGFPWRHSRGGTQGERTQGFPLKERIDHHGSKPYIGHRSSLDDTMEGSDVMMEISGFLEEYESCVRGRMEAASRAITEATEDPKEASYSTEVDTVEDTEDTVIEDVGGVLHHHPSSTVEDTVIEDVGGVLHHHPSSTTIPPAPLDQYLRDIDGIIKTSREAQDSFDSVLGLATGLQGLFQSVMVERNQAVDDLKKSVSLLRCSVERLQKMREEMNRMADRETAVAAKEAAAEVRLGEAARLERDLAHRLDKVDCKEANIQRQISEHARRLEEVTSREATVAELTAAVERREADTARRLADVTSREGFLDAKEAEMKSKIDQINEQNREIEAMTASIDERERSLKAEVLAWSQGMDEKRLDLQRLEEDISQLAMDKVAIETDRRAAREELRGAEARVRALKEQADEIEAAQEPTRLELESNRAEIQSIRRERESFEDLKRDIVAQGHRAIESAEKCRAEQMTLALIKRDSIRKASQLYVNHLEAAMEFGSSPEFLSNLRALLDRHFCSGPTAATEGGNVIQVDRTGLSFKTGARGLDSFDLDPASANAADPDAIDPGADFKIKAELCT